MLTEAPRGATWVAELYVIVSKLVRSFGSLAVGFMQHLFKDRPSGPDDCKNAYELRAYANRIMHKDPSFAKELNAAIDRSEQR